MWLKYLTSVVFSSLWVLSLWLIWYLDWELISRNNPFLNIRDSMQCLMSHSIMLLQLPFFSSSLQPRLPAFDIAPFCLQDPAGYNTSQWSRCLSSPPVWQQSLSSRNLREPNGSGSAGWGCRQPAGTQLDFAKAVFPLCHMPLELAAVPFVVPVAQATDHAFSRFCKHQLQSASSVSQRLSVLPVPVGKFAEVAIKSTINHHKPFLQMNAALSGIISCWKHPHSPRLQGSSQISLKPSVLNQVYFIVIFPVLFHF